MKSCAEIHDVEEYPSVAGEPKEGDDVVRHAVRCGRTVWSITLRKTMKKKKTQERSMTSSIRGFSSQHSKAISEAAATLDATENTEAG